MVGEEVPKKNSCESLAIFNWFVERAERGERGKERGDL